MVLFSDPKVSTSASALTAARVAAGASEIAWHKYIFRCCQNHGIKVEEVFIFNAPK
jgi:hypothetical protein